MSPDVSSARSRSPLSLRAIAQVIIGLGALALVIWKADARGLIEAVKATRWAYLPFAVAATFAVTWLMAYRWRLILGVRGHQIRARRLFVYYLIGIFFTNLVPGGGVSGDVARLIYADREVRDKPFVLSTLVYERLVGMFTLLLTGVAATLASRLLGDSRRLIYTAEALLACALIATAILMSSFISSRLARLAEQAGERVGAKRVGAAVARTLEAIADLRRYKSMLAATVGLSILIRVVWGVSFFIVAQAMNLPLSLPYVIALTSLVEAVRMLPISVGGLGVREWIIVALLANIGIEREQALMFSFLGFAPVMLNAVLGGIIYTSRAGFNRAVEPVADVKLEKFEV